MTGSRPLWLMTLADLALLLLGFLILVHATGDRDERAVAAGIRGAFGGDPAWRPSPAAEMPLDINIVTFAAGAVEANATPALDWAAVAAADPRSRLLVSGEADPAEGLGVAARRAATVADAIARDGRVPTNRVRLDARLSPDARRVVLAISYGR